MARTFIGNIRGPKGDPGASIAIDVEYNNTNSGLQAENVQDAIDEIKESIPTKAEDIGADASGSANTALENAKTYTDTKISNLINGAPEAMDTLKEVADAMAENEDVVEALNAAIGNKANTSDLTVHTNNKNNPHGVTAEQIGAVSETGDNSNTTTTFTQATTRANISTGEKLSVIMGKISKWFADLKTVAFTGSYTDLSNKPAASDIGAIPSTIISSVTDFNNFTTTGVYHIKFTGAANQPTAHNGTLIVEHDVGTPSQIWLPDNQYVIYKRIYTNNTWSDWSKMDAGKADSATNDSEGRNIASALNKFANINGNCEVYDGDLNDIENNSFYNVDVGTDKNSPTGTWGFVITLMHTYAKTYGIQLFISMTGDNAVYTRQKGVDTWYDWAIYMNEDNVGEYALLSKALGMGDTTDFNDFKTTGVYHINNGNEPNNPTQTHGTLFVEFDVGTPNQIWLPDNQYVIYKRIYTNNTWSDWSKMDAGHADSAGTIVDYNDSTNNIRVGWKGDGATSTNFKHLAAYIEDSGVIKIKDVADSVLKYRLPFLPYLNVKVAANSTGTIISTGSPVLYRSLMLLVAYNHAGNSEGDACWLYNGKLYPLKSCGSGTSYSTLKNFTITPGSQYKLTYAGANAGTSWDVRVYNFHAYQPWL